MAIIEQFSTHFVSPQAWHMPAVPPVAESRSVRAPPSLQAARNAANFIQVEDGSSTVTYSPNRASAADGLAAALRTQACIPPDCPLFYFEVHIVYASGPPVPTRLAIGIQASEAQPYRLPGLEPNTFALHNDSGLFFNDSHGKPYDLRFGEGDTVGVCVDRVRSTLCFVKNGLSRGPALHSLPTKRLYPCLGFDLSHAKVRVNFGHEPFKFAMLLESLRSDARVTVCREIAGTSIADAAQGKLGSQGPLLAVLDHLIHRCCWKTAQAVASTILCMPNASTSKPHWTDADVLAVCKRQKILQLIISGDCSKARGLMDELAPGMLAADSEVRFTVNMQCFVELLRATVSSEEQLAAMTFARTELGHDSSSLSFDKQEALREALTLLAYANPHECPSAHLFQQSCRQQCADVVNGALMRWAGKDASSALDKLCRQLHAVHQELSETGAFAARVVSVNAVMREGLLAGTDAGGGLAELRFDVPNEQGAL